MAVFPIPKGFQRLGLFAIDATDLYSDYASLATYASTNPTAYAGQLCRVFVSSTQTDTYVINQDKSLTLIGSGSGSTVGWTGTFLTGDSRTATVVNGLIVSVMVDGGVGTWFQFQNGETVEWDTGVPVEWGSVDTEPPPETSLWQFGDASYIQFQNGENIQI
jgi:hypothetical protein